MDYQVRLIKMPYKIKALTVLNADDSFTIFINSGLSCEQQRKSLLHELEHISNGDFDRIMSVDQIERIRHMEG